MTYLRANVQGERSVVSEDRVETKGLMDRQTDGRLEVITLPDALVWSVTGVCACVCVCVCVCLCVCPVLAG